MSVGIPIGEPGVLMRNTSWQQYVELRDSDEHRHVRMTFDRGELELMSPSGLHERLNFLIGHCIFAWVEEMRIPLQGCGSTTFRRRNDALQVLVLNSESNYAEVGASQSLPGFPIARMVDLLKRRNTADGVTLVREFRGWCRPDRLTAT